MHDRLIEVLDRIDAVLADARDIGSGPDVEASAIAAQRVRLRLDYPEDLALVALAGGTGSGKSSLFNVLLGVETAEVGALRPTTSEAMASVASSRGDEIRGYLDRMGVTRLRTHEEPSWLAMLDLPDTDSVDDSHRVEVERILPQVDAVVWVVDVEKYRDAALHRGFLQNLVDYESQFLFVLNQVDRLQESELEPLLADFRASLLDDGFEDPSILAVAANPRFSSPRGIEEFVERLRDLIDGSVIDKLIVDLETEVKRLGDALGSGLDFDARWNGVRRDAVEMASGGDVIGASRKLADFFHDLADETTGDPSEAALGLSAHAGEILRRLVAEADTELLSSEKPAKRLRFGRDEPMNPPEWSAWLERGLDRAVDDELRALLRARAGTVAKLAAVAVDVANLRSDDDR